MGIVLSILTAILSVTAFAWIASEASGVGQKYLRKVGPPALVAAVGGVLLLGFVSSGWWILVAAFSGPACISMLIEYRHNKQLFKDPPEDESEEEELTGDEVIIDSEIVEPTPEPEPKPEPEPVMIGFPGRPYPAEVH